MITPRLALARAMQAELNCWMWDYAHAVGQIAKALVDGRLPAVLLDVYPKGGDYPEQLSAAIAAQSSIKADATRGEAIGLAVENLRAVAAGTVAIHGAGFSFYEETLERHRLTRQRAGELMREHSGGTLLGAAQLFVDAFLVPIDDAYRDWIPAVQGNLHGRDLDYRYRVWTIRHDLAFDDMPTLHNGGPALVPVDGWHKSVTVPAGWTPEHAAVHDGKTELHVWRGDYRQPDRHPLDGTRHDSMLAADRAAYNAAVIGFMVYETHVHRYPALHV
jgi:hypothetical protein